VVITPARQRNAVSQGMALGLVLCDRTSLPYDKVRVDLAFEGAWRSWEYRQRFPQVNTDLGKGLDGVHAMTRATQSKQVWVLYWDPGGAELVIHARQPDCDPNNDADVQYARSMIDGDVPLAGWVALARDFLERFER
jgi:hypothetical protein